MDDNDGHKRNRQRVHYKNKGLVCMDGQARLVLEDGTVFTGKCFGARDDQVGEVVFNTAMTGYQEILSDPSYCGQIVTMTYPLIGNYGISHDDFESFRPYVHGLIVRDYECIPSNWRAARSLDEWLKQYGIVGISHIDTRMLTRTIRRVGSMKGMITTGSESIEKLVQRINTNSKQEQNNEVSKASTRHVYYNPGHGERIVLIDYGAKTGILRELNKRGCNVIVVPYDTTAEQIRLLNPDGIQLSNGPGDPKSLPEAVQTIADLLSEYVIFGICLGHQLIALAAGANTHKLKFGHRGSNHPVKELASGRCFITSQNHGYTVEKTSIEATDLEVTHVHNNDQSIEGLCHKKFPVFSVQYHPEAAPGPYDSTYLFDQFIALVRQHQKTRVQKRKLPDTSITMTGVCE